MQNFGEENCRTVSPKKIERDTRMLPRMEVVKDLSNGGASVLTELNIPVSSFVHRSITESFNQWVSESANKIVAIFRQETQGKKPVWWLSRRGENIKMYFRRTVHEWGITRTASGYGLMTDSLRKCN